MFYVCAKKGKNFTVLDTNDGVKEDYSSSQLFQIAKQVEILGVYDNVIIPIRPEKEILRFFTCGDYEKAIELMPLYTDFTLNFESKPNGLGMISKEEINISRKDEATYTTMEGGRSKSYRTRYQEELVDYISWYFKSQRLIRCKEGK